MFHSPVEVSEAGPEPDNEAGADSFSPLTPGEDFKRPSLRSTLIIEDGEDVELWDEAAKAAFATAVKKEVGVQELDGVTYTISFKPISKDARARMEEEQNRPIASTAMAIEVNFEFSNADDARHAYQTMSDKGLANIVEKCLQAGPGNFVSTSALTFSGPIKQTGEWTSRRRRASARLRPNTAPAGDHPSRLTPLLTDKSKKKLPLSKAEEAKSKANQFIDNEDDPSSPERDDYLDSTVASTPSSALPTDLFYGESPALSMSAPPRIGAPSNQLTELTAGTTQSGVSPSSNGFNVFFNAKEEPPILDTRLPSLRAPSPRSPRPNNRHTRKPLLPSSTKLPPSGIERADNLVLLRVG